MAGTVQPSAPLELTQIFEPIREDLEAVEREFARHIESRVQLIPEIGRYIQNSGGKRFAVLEATSHGLSERTSRLAHVRFQAAVCTNITHEHLDLHGTFEAYRAAKVSLFERLGALLLVVAAAGALAVATAAIAPMNAKNMSDWVSHR